MSLDASGPYLMTSGAIAIGAQWPQARRSASMK
jgi:hypothetical protein